MSTSALDRLTERLALTDSGCLEFTGAKDKDGYGYMMLERRRWRVTRLAYALFVGELIDGMMILHNCDNPACCRPDHLYQGTAQDNVDDMRTRGRAGWDHRARWTHCPRGHEYGPENQSGRGVKRRCRICYNAAQRKYDDPEELRAARARGAAKARAAKALKFSS